MEPDVIKSLYYMYKRQIIQFYKLNKGGSGFSESFVYAIAHDCYPYFHVDDEVKIYKDCFSIKYEYIDKVIKFLDEKWQKGQLYTFYELEEQFNYPDVRVMLIVTLRYCYLDSRFNDEEFWKKIESSAPVETHGLNTPFDSDWEI